MNESDIYRDVGKHRWPYVDEPRPLLPRHRRPGAGPVPAEPEPRPLPVTQGEGADV